MLEDLGWARRTSDGAEAAGCAQARGYDIPMDMQMPVDGCRHAPFVAASTAKPLLSPDRQRLR
jgi:hypothetical protein